VPTGHAPQTGGHRSHVQSNRGPHVSITVTAILCAYTLDRADQLMAALESVRTQVPPPREILVIIDHNEELLDWVRAQVSQYAEDYGISTVPSTGPPGLSGARNTGVELATGDVVAFLDDDAEAEPGWLAHLLGPYSDPAVVSVGGSVVPAWESHRPSWFPEEFGWVVGCSYRGQPTRLGPVRNAIGANISFRRSSLIAAGGFSDRVGRIGADAHGCEETEASIRVSRQEPGSRVLLEPAARVRHWVPEQRTTWSYFRRRCYAEGKSKAVVSDLVGGSDGLASERDYVRSTLPSGVATAVSSAWRHRDPRRTTPAAAIVAGLMVTATGYLVASMQIPRAVKGTPS
jgi:hypothetical protein